MVYLRNSFLFLTDVILPGHILECWLLPLFALFLENAFHTCVLQDLQTQSGVSQAASQKVRIKMARLMLWTLLEGAEGQKVTGGSFKDVLSKKNPQTHNINNTESFICDYPKVINSSGLFCVPEL